MNDKIIKRGDGSMVESKVVFQTEHYKGLHKKVDIDKFFIYAGLTKDKFDNHKSGLRISIAHHTLAQNIRTSIMKVNTAGMVRGLVSIGAIALAKNKNVLWKTVSALENFSDEQRVKKKNKRFKETLSRVNPEIPGIKENLRTAIEDYGDNEYGLAIWTKVHDIWAMTKPNYNEDVKLVVPSSILDRCRNMCRKPLDDKMFALSQVKKNDVDAQNVIENVNISNRFMIILHEYKKLHLQDKTDGQILRGCYVAGLYILSKWILADKIAKGEYMFNKLIDAVDKITSEYA